MAPPEQKHDPPLAAEGVAATPVLPELTQLLQRWEQGDGKALAEVFQHAYAKLREMAGRRLERDAAQSLTPTELLHEAFLRVSQEDVGWHNRAHFFASMSLYLRSVLVDHARARLAQKRSAGLVQVSISLADAPQPDYAADLCALDQALQQLERLDARCAEALHLSCFAGLERTEIAEVLQVSVPTVDRDLRFARAWVKQRLRQ